MHLNIDIETYSECKLKSQGLFRYAEDPTTEVLCVCYSFDDGPVSLWIPVAEKPLLVDPERVDGHIWLGPECPPDLEKFVAEGGECHAWNSQFERTVLNGHAGQAIGFPSTPIEQWICSAARAATHSLPRALGNAAKAVGTHEKDETGKNAMLALCKPRGGKVKRYDLYDGKDGSEKYAQLFDYCTDDVRSERGIDEYLPPFSPSEKRAFFLDQRINDRGVRVDMERVNDALNLVQQYRGRLKKKCMELINLSPSQTEKLAMWVRNEGYDIEDLQAPTIQEALNDPECPEHVRKILLIRSIYSMKAPDKYKAMERSVAEDGRLHGMFLYHGASTGRWSSLIVQLQNLFRPHKEVDADLAIDAFYLRDLDWLATLFGVNPMVTLASCIRGMLIPEEGHDLLCLDFSQIEARVIAWLAGQQSTLEVFFRGEDIYKHTAAGIYRIEVEEVSDEERFIGKVATLALGFQGGKVAFAKMAKNYGQDIPEDLAEKVKLDWRAANPEVVRLWYAMEEAAKAAIANPGSVYKVAHGKVMFKVENEFLYMRLPSGRRLAYLKPELRQDKITFMGVNTYTRQWGRCDTYGGKLVENAVQAIARDLLLHGMFNLEDAGYDTIGTVHDEDLMEVPEWFGSMEEASAIMCDTPDWAEGIPVAADGFRAKRYRK